MMTYEGPYTWHALIGGGSGDYPTDWLPDGFGLVSRVLEQFGALAGAAEPCTPRRVIAGLVFLCVFCVLTTLRPCSHNLISFYLNSADTGTGRSFLLPAVFVFS